jgi:hypothetical protein
MRESSLRILANTARMSSETGGFTARHIEGIYSQEKAIAEGNNEMARKTVTIKR